MTFQIDYSDLNDDITNSSLQSATSLRNPMRSEHKRYWSLRTFTTGIRSVRISSIKIRKYSALLINSDPHSLIAVAYRNWSDQIEKFVIDCAFIFRKLIT